MSVSFQQDEDILKVFQHGNYIGYVDAERMLHMFDKSGHSVPWRNVEDRQQVAACVKEWFTSSIKPEDIIDMLLTLVPADKIDHEAVKQAKRYMMR